MDCFTKSQTFSEQWPFVYSGNKLYSHKKGKSLLITNFNHNLGNKVSEWNFSEPKYHFSQDKIQ